MKIFKIILIISAITLIASKAEKAKANLSAKKDNFSENPIAGVAVPNDNYILQQAEVNIKLILINFSQGFRKPIMMSTIPRSINNNLNTGIIEKADAVNNLK